MSLAKDTRRAVRARPWLLSALRAGVVNYAAAARSLDIGAEPDAVATAIRRFEERLPPLDAGSHDARVTMDRDAANATDLAASLLAASKDSSDAVAVVTVSGDVDTQVLQHCLGCLHAVGIDVHATAAVDDRLVLLVPRRTAPDTVRTVEVALATVPGSTTF